MAPARIPRPSSRLTPRRLPAIRMWLQAALNGSRSQADHPAIPITPEEQAAAARESVEAGASAIHTHVRGPDGRESLASGPVAAILGAIRGACPRTPVGISTGIWIVPEPDARLDAVRDWAVLPDFASVNFDEPGAAALADLLLARGVEIEAGLRDAPAAEVLAQSGLADRCLRVLLEPDAMDPEAALETTRAIERVLKTARVDAGRLLHGTDASAWPLLQAAARLGYASRIGFEDTLSLPDGTRAAANAALVRAARRLKS